MQTDLEPQVSLFFFFISLTTINYGHYRLPLPPHLVMVRRAHYAGTDTDRKQGTAGTQKGDDGHGGRYGRGLRCVAVRKTRPPCWGEGHFK